MAFDVNLNLRTGTTNLTADETQNAGVDVGPTPISGLSCVVNIPSVGTITGDTFVLKIQECTESATNSTYWRDLVTFPTFTYANSAGTHVRRFASRLRYIRAHIDVTNAATTQTQTWNTVGINVGLHNWDKEGGVAA